MAKKKYSTGLFSNEEIAQIEQLGNSTRFGEEVYDPKSLYTETTGDTAFDNSSKYNEYLVSGTNVDKQRAQNQGILDELGNTAVKATINGGLGIIGTAANLLDIRNLANTFNPEVNHNYRNFITDATDAVRSNLDENFPVYKENPDKLIDFTDSAWWADAIGTTAESAIGFGVAGEGIAKGLDKLTKLANAAQAFKTAQALEKTNQLTTAIALTYAEGVQTAAQAGQKMLEQGVPEEEISKHLATIVRTNMFNVLVNYTSLSPVFRTNRLSRRLQNKTLKPLIGETAEQYAKRTGKELSDLINPTNTFRKMALEAPQEAFEEGWNVYAENQGYKEAGLLSAENADLLHSFLSEEGQQAMLLGAFGGIANTAALQGIENASKNKAGQNSNDLIKQQFKNQSNLIKEQIANGFGKPNETLAQSISKIANLQNSASLLYGDEDLAAENPQAYQQILQNTKDGILDEVSYINFANGTTDALLQHLNSLSSLTNDEIKQNNYAESDEEISKFKEQVQKSIHKVKENEKSYNDLAFKYESEGQDYIKQLYDYKTKINTLDTSVKDLNIKKSETLNNLRKDIAALNIEPKEAEGIDPTTSKFYQKTYGNQIVKLDSFQQLQNIEEQSQINEELLNDLTNEYNKISSKKYRDEAKAKVDKEIEIVKAKEEEAKYEEQKVEERKQKVDSETETIDEEPVYVKSFNEINSKLNDNTETLLELAKAYKKARGNNRVNIKNNIESLESENVKLKENLKEIQPLYDTYLKAREENLNEENKKVDTEEIPYNESLTNEEDINQKINQFVDSLEGKTKPQLKYLLKKLQSKNTSILRELNDAKYQVKKGNLEFEDDINIISLVLKLNEEKQEVLKDKIYNFNKKEKLKQEEKEIIEEVNKLEPKTKVEDFNQEPTEVAPTEAELENNSTDFNDFIKGEPVKLKPINNIFVEPKTELDELDITNEINSLSNEDIKNKGKAIRKDILESSKLATKLINKGIELDKFTLSDVVYLFNSPNWRETVKNNFDNIKKYVKIIQVASKSTVDTDTLRYGLKIDKYGNYELVANAAKEPDPNLPPIQTNVDESDSNLLTSDYKNGSGLLLADASSVAYKDNASQINPTTGKISNVYIDGKIQVENPKAGHNLFRIDGLDIFNVPVELRVESSNDFNGIPNQDTQDKINDINKRREESKEDIKNVLSQEKEIRWTTFVRDEIGRQKNIGIFDTKENLIVKIDEYYDNEIYNLEKDNLEELDKLDIAFYTTFGDNTIQTGYLGKISSLKERVAESGQWTIPQIIALRKEFAQNLALKKQAEFTNRGQGFINLNLESQSLKDFLENDAKTRNPNNGINDSKILLGVVSNNEVKTVIGSVSNIDGDLTKTKEDGDRLYANGSKVILIPHVVNGEKLYRPVLLETKRFSAIKGTNLYNKLADILQRIKEQKATKELLSDLGRFIYYDNLTQGESKYDTKEIGNRGLLIVKNPENEKLNSFYVNGNIENDVEKVLDQLYPNIDGVQLQNNYDYYNELINSNLFSTKVAAINVTNPITGKVEPTYFSQHTIQFRVKENTQLNNEPVEDTDSFINNDTEFDELDVPTDSALITDLPANVQDLAIRSISSILLNNPKIEGVTNKEQAYNKLLQTRELVTKIIIDNKPTQQVPINIINENNTVNNLNKVIEKFDEFYKRAEQRIAALNFQETEDGYYETLEESDEAVNQYIDDSVLHENRKERASALVKKFLYTQVEIGNNGQAKVNKELFLESMIDYDSTFNTLQLELSNKVYPSNTEGFKMMLATLAESKNPTINNIGKQLSNNFNALKNERLVNSFFTLFSQQHALYKTLINTLEDATGLTSFINQKLINSDSNNARTALINAWEQNFYETENPLLIKEVNTDGYTNLKINTTFGKTLKEQFNKIVNDDTNYTIAKNSVILNKPSIEKLATLLNSLGISISKEGLESYLFFNSKGQYGINHGLALKSNNDSLSKLFDRVSGSIIEKEGDEKDNLLSSNNIFENEGSTLRKLAKAEYQFVKNVFSMSFRREGKSYYSFIRTTPLSDTLLNLDNPSFIKDRLNNDVFAKYSSWLKAKDANPDYTIELAYELGLTNRSNKENKLLKDTIDEEFEAYRVQLFQQGKSNEVWFVTDTHSDKTTKPLIRTSKQNVNYTKENDKYQFSEGTLNLLFNYYKAERDRIIEVQNQNKTLPADKRIKGYHGKEGLGSKFLLYYMFNAELLDKDSALYKELYTMDDEGNIQLKNDTDTAEKLIKEMLNEHFNKIIEQQRKDWINSGVIKFDKNKVGFNYFNKAYVENIKSTKGLKTNEQVIDYALADYVINYSVQSMEMLMLTGDPAQQAKIKGNILDSVKATFDNVSKRNARLLAQKEKGLFDNPDYNVTYLKDDLKWDTTNSVVDSYPKEFREAYKDAEKATDAQNYTTLNEHLEVMKAYGKITSDEQEKVLEMLDPEHYKMIYGQQPRQFTEQEINDKIQFVLGAQKPVIVNSEVDTDLKITKQTYIKPSNIPIIPSLVKGRLFEKVHKAMLQNKIDRVAFVTSIKLGVTNPKSLLKDNGEFNDKFFEGNIHKLSRDGFGIQLDLPYDADKTSIGEGTQFMKLLFSDLKDTDKVGDNTIGDLKQAFNALHEELYNEKKEALLEEIGAVKGSIDVNNVGKLASIIEQEAKNRDYSTNAINALKVNNGEFRIPLSFNTFSSKIEPVLLSLFTKKLTKFKLPGKSYVQSSEAIIRGYDRRNVKELTDVKNKSSIVWTKPEYMVQDRLKYMEKTDNGIKPAQILIPSYFKGVDLTQYVNDKGFLELDKIDSSLLEIFGFRVPTQGHNSMMAFEIVGFLPDYMGDVVIVPHEIAAQMGSDYDVDKLFIHTNHFAQLESGIIGKDATNPEQKILDISKQIILSKVAFEKVIKPLDTTNLADNIKRLELAKQTEFLGGFTPLFQKDQYFENRAGQFGVGVTANSNTNHANSQNANLYITEDNGVFAVDKNGNTIFESIDDIQENRVNEFTDDLYDGKQGFKGLFRLDLVNSYNTNTGKFDGRPISEIISEWLGVSVDNAKDKTLGKGGINQQNFNVAMLIARVGLDNEWILPFINQPILKEYYKRVGNIDSIYDRVLSSTKDKQDIIVKELKEKYYNTDERRPLQISELEKTLKEPIEKNAKQQIEILNSFLYYDRIAADLRTLQSNTNVDVKGLPKSTLELADKVKNIDSLVSDLKYLGNVDKFKTNTISGVFENLPSTALKAYKNLFIDNKPAFKTQINKVKMYKGYLSNEDALIVRNHIQMYTYTHPEIISNLLGEESYQDFKQRMLFGENSLAKRIKQLQTKYKNNYMIGRLVVNRDINNVNNPSTIVMNNTTSETKVFEDNILAEWTSMLQSSNEELKQFGNDLAKYTLLFSAQQNSASNLVKYLPISYLDSINFGKILSNLDYDNADLMSEFYDQFLKHNPSFSKSGFKLVEAIKKDPKIGKIVNNKQFKDIVENITFNASYDGFAVEIDGENQLPLYINLKSKNNRELYKLQNNGNGTMSYVRQSTLGVNNLSEYLFNAEPTSAFEEKNVFNKPKTIEIEEPNKNIWKGKESYFGNEKGEFTSSKDLIANLLSAPNLSEDYKELTTLLLDQELTYNVGETTQANKIAFTSEIENKIFLNKEKLMKKSDSEIQRIILHEALHSLTLTKLKDKKFLYSPLGQQLLKIFGRAKDEIVKSNKQEYEMFNKALLEWKKTSNTPESKSIAQILEEQNKGKKFTEKDVKELKDKYYGLYDINEFVSETMTNKDFQDKLKNISGLWDKILEFFSNLLSGKRSSLLTNATDTIISLIKEKDVKESKPVIEEDEMYKNLVPIDASKFFNVSDELDTTITEFMKGLTREERQTFRELREKGIIKTKC